MAPLIIAHRGGAPHLGENSRPAFESGLRSGADMLEIDVQRSADGYLIITHDDEITLRNGLIRPVGALPLGELQREIDGLITFQEYLEVFGSQIMTNVDLKISGYEREIVQTLRSFDLLDQVLISSRDAGSLRAVRFLAPEVRTGLSRGQIVPWLGKEPHSSIAAAGLRPTLPAQLLAHARWAMTGAFMLNYRLIQPWLVNFLHGRGYQVFCWTVNDVDVARDLRASGVDGIATDYPEQLIAGSNRPDS
jgi:glycerophosphoryl diester phosphodiesterase